MTTAPNWEREGQDWPNREASRFVSTRTVRWHVQVTGSGPVLLLVHGTGASTHSWRDLIPRLAARCTVVAPDLPGHAFTSNPGPGGLSLPAIAKSLGDLMRALDLGPDVIVGHSSGAAIAIRATLDGQMTPRAIISFNGALLPFQSTVGQLFSPMAKLLARAPMVPALLSWRAGNPRRVKRVLEGTGSRIDATGLDLYWRLLRYPEHVAGALGMMASWDLAAFARDLPRLRTPLLLLAGGDDQAVPAEQIFDVRAMVPGATTTYLRGLGHLAHEEDPITLSDFILRAVSRYADLPDAPSTEKVLPHTLDKP